MIRIGYGVIAAGVMVIVFAALFGFPKYTPPYIPPYDQLQPAVWVSRDLHAGVVMQTVATCVYSSGAATQCSEADTQ